MEVHVVSKADHRQHATFTVAATPGKLAESSIRVRTQLISLTMNNLTYARMGEIFRWWDAYPVSDSYPAPYNDPSAWGIGPAWGLAEIEESTIPELKPGTLLHGFWPTTSTPTDLKLKASGVGGLWIETSEHRLSLMPLYNRYSEVSTSLPLSELAASSSPSAKDELDRLAWSAFIVLKSGYYLSEHVFSPNPETQPPIHPLGSQIGLPWTSDDADLSSAAVVTLASSTKTALGFVSALQKRPKKAGPLGLLQVTSSVKSVSEGSNAAESPFRSKAVEYSQIDSQEVVEWLKSFNASKIVIFNFGAGSEALERIQAVAKNDPALQFMKVVVILISSEQKFLSPEEAKVAREAMAGSSNILYNTSGIEDSLIQSLGLGPFMEISNSRTKQMLDNRHNLPGRLVWGRGVSGAAGIEGAWDRLSQAQVDADEYLVYQVQQA